MSSRLVIKDAVRQLIGRVISALFGFLIIKIITPYLWPLRYWDYSTILKYFAIWTALADLGLYVLAVKELGRIKDKEKDPEHTELKSVYGKFVGTRIILMWVVYAVAIIVAYFLPAYTSNPYLVWGLPFGMIFSASFMFAGIQQLPLQIFWRMDQLSISLIVARLSQIVILIPVVFLFFRHMEFNWTSLSILAFCMIIFSVVASGIGQNIDIHRRSKKILPLKIHFDLNFTKYIIKRNWQYGVSYYLSSFHTLIVLLFLGWFFPTSSWHDYVWIWALALSLIEILLIVPSSLWNSLLHKISAYSQENKRKSMWNLLTLIFWIGGIVAINFWIFADWIIRFVSGKGFLWVASSIRDRWSDQVLPFLGIVLRWSFIKQVYNYLFVSVDKQNTLLPINLVWVLVWIPVWIIIIPKYGLLWWIITQGLIEFLFMSGAIWIAKRKKVQPIITWNRFFSLISILVVFAGVTFLVDKYFVFNWWTLFGLWWLVNGLMILVSLPYIKKVAKWLALE